MYSNIYSRLKLSYHTRVLFYTIFGSMPNAKAHTSLIPIQTMTDPRGDLSIVQSGKHVPFLINRIFYVYNVPVGSIRGGHAHKKNEQIHICIAGSVAYELDYGDRKEEVTLNSPDTGLYMTPLVWHSMKDFMPGTILLVLNSEPYDETEYYRDYADFQKNILKE